MTMNEPTPFITYDEDESKFHIHETACEILSSLDASCPVYVVSIAGLYRTGKSFIMNQLNGGRTKGFNLGSSVEPCTQGIWLWSVDASNNDIADLELPKNMKLILLDTEGLGSYTKTETYDVQIFSLALLLSSYFVYNSLGSIDETALDRLSLVLELSKHIQAQTNADKGSDPYQLKMFFPSFMWLVRDFSLELVIGGRHISPREYLENALLPAKGDSERVHGKNQIRQAITEFFQDRSCFTMKRPVADEEQLHHLADLPESQFRPEYLQQVKEFKRMLLTRIRPKTLFGEKLNGPMLVSLARSYVDSINEGGIPTIRSAWENVSEMQNAKAADAAKKLYSQTLMNLVEEREIIELEELDGTHHEAEYNAYELFNNMAVGDNKKEHLDEVREHIVDLYGKVREENSRRSEKDSEMLINNLIRPLLDAVASREFANIEALEEQWESAIENYQVACRGPMKHIVLVSVLRQRPLETSRKVAAQMGERLRKEAEAKMKEQIAKAEEEYSRLQQLYDNVDSEWKRSLESNKELSEEKRALEERLRTAEQLRREYLESISKLENQVKKEQQQNQSLQEDVQKLQKALRDTEGAVGELKDGYNKSKAEKEALEAELANKKKCCVM